MSDFDKLWDDYRNGPPLVSLNRSRKRKPGKPSPDLVTVPRAELEAWRDALEPFRNAAIGVTEFAPDFPMHGAALRASFDWYDKVQGGKLKRHSVRRSDLEVVAALFTTIEAHLKGQP